MQAWCFCIFELCHSLGEFFPADRIFEFPKGAVLGNLFNEGGISCLVVVVDSIKVGGED